MRTAAVPGGEPAPRIEREAFGPLLDLDALAMVECSRDPYPHLIVPSFVRADALDRINADFPTIVAPAAFKLEQLAYGPAFAAFVEQLRSEAFARLISDKFGIDVTGLPRTISVRKCADESDGNIHTDSRTKVVTVLVYLNDDWTQRGARLRLLRSGIDIEDYVAEIVPKNGMMFAFQRAENSWHGFLRYTGERRSLQMQYSLPKRAERGNLHKFLKKRVMNVLRRVTPLLAVAADSTCRRGTIVQWQNADR